MWKYVNTMLQVWVLLTQMRVEGFFFNVEGINLTFSFHQVACWGNTVETAFHPPWILQTVLPM